MSANQIKCDYCGKYRDGASFVNGMCKLCKYDFDKLFNTVFVKVVK